MVGPYPLKHTAGKSVFSLAEARTAAQRSFAPPFFSPDPIRDWETSVAMYITFLRLGGPFMIDSINAIESPPAHVLPYLSVSELLRIERIRSVMGLWDRPLTGQFEQSTGPLQFRLSLEVSEHEEKALKELGLEHSFSALPLTVILRDRGTFELLGERDLSYDVMDGKELIVVPLPPEGSRNLRLEVLGPTGVTALFHFDQ